MKRRLRQLLWVLWVLGCFLLPSLLWAGGSEPLNTVPSQNSSYLATLQTFLRSEIGAWLSRYSDTTAWVQSGGLHTTAGTCTSSAIALEGTTTAGNRITADGAGGSVALQYDAVNIGANCANPGSDVCWVVGSAAGQAFSATNGRTVVSMPTLPASAFHRVGTSNLYVDCTSSSEPALPADSVFLMKTTITNGAITAVRDFRKPASYARARVFDLTDPLYGGVGDDTTDNVTAWGKALEGVASHGGTLHIPNGRYKFNSKPAALYGGVMVECETQAFGVLIRNYNGSAGIGFLDMDVANVPAVGGLLTNSGGGVRNCTLFAPTGTTGGAAVNMQSSSATAQGFLMIDNLYITGVGLWNYGVRMDGSLKTTAPEGIRDVVVKDTKIFQADTISVLALGFNHVHLQNVQGFGSTGGGLNECLVADSGTGSTINSEDLTVHLGFCSSTVRLGSANVATLADVRLLIPHTTTLTLNANLSNVTFLGDAGTTSGLMSVGNATHVSLMTPGRITAHVTAPTSGGGSLETGNGVTFPATQVPLNQANTLDDFEKGTFTPLVFGSAAAGVTTYTAQYGYYTKIGNLVHITLIVAWSNQTGAGNLTIGGLPYPPINDGSYTAALAVTAHNLLVGAGLQLTATTALAATEIKLQAFDPGGGALTNVAVDVAASVYIAGTYLAAN